MLIANNHKIYYNNTTIKHNYHLKKDNGYTGNLFEADLLYPHGDKRLRQMRAISPQDVEYFPYRKAVQDVLNNPLGYTAAEQIEPPAPWLGDVHAYIVQELSPGNYHLLQACPTLKRSMDIKHGADLIFLYQDSHTANKYLVTVDLTTNPKKAYEFISDASNHESDKNYKADVFVSEDSAFINPNRGLDENIFSLPVADGLNARQEHQEKLAQRKGVASVIVDAIRQKIAKGEVYEYGPNNRQTDLRRNWGRSFSLT